MTDAQDILSGRLAQAQGILNSLLIDEQHDNLACRELNNTLWAIDTLIEQAIDAFRDMDGPAKPDAPVMMDGEKINNLRRESLAVLREVTEQAEDAVFIGRKLLNAVDKRDKDASQAVEVEL